jgi:all-trans-retinol 13,14-reductase
LSKRHQKRWAKPRKKGEQRKIVVIGSGVGGLTAAAYLARAGYVVTLYEQHPSIGGVTTTITQDGFSWDLGPVLVEGFGPHERGGALLRELEIANRVPLKAGDRGYVFPDFDLRKPTVYPGPHWRRERLQQLFPSERDGIDRYYRYHNRMTALAAARTQADTARGPAKLLRSLHLWLAEAGAKGYRDGSAQRLLDDVFVDRRLKAVFSSVLTGLGVQPSRFAAAELPPLNAEHLFDQRIPQRPGLLSAVLFGGKRPSYHFILGGCGTLISAIADRFRESGGKLYTGAAVEKILINADRVIGVRLVGGHTEPADVVIASGGARETFYHLVGREYLPSGLAYQIDIEPRMESVMMVHLGIDFDPRPYQPDPVCTYYGTYDVEGTIAACRQGYYHQGHDGFVIYIPTLHSPELAPAGQHAVTLYAVAPNELQQGTWQRRRRELTQTLIAGAEEVIPGLRAHTQSQVVLTPHDFRALTHQTHHAFGGRAPVMGHEGPGYETAIQGLWFIGSQSKSGGGIQPVMVGAREAARAIQRQGPR